MNYLLKLKVVILVFLLLACNIDEQSSDFIDKEENKLKEESPNDMLTRAYQLFKEGNDKESIELANKVLEIGRQSNNDTLIGRALTSLCRNSQRKLDTIRLSELSNQLIDLATSSQNKQWIMYQAHMNAEMYRLVGNLNKAESYYDQSMEISFEIKAMEMYMIDHFNKSFVSTAKGDFSSARDLIKKYYTLREDLNRNPEDPYGLIALAYLLEQEGSYEEAHEVATVTRRLFKEQNLFPEPPDEKPLLIVEKKVTEVLDNIILDSISNESDSATVPSLLTKYLFINKPLK
mgnify:CR=1 FL=1